MADEADPENVPAVKNVDSRAVYRPVPRRVTRKLGSTDMGLGPSMPVLRYLLTITLSLLVSARAFGATAHRWVIVTSENPPDPVADNVDALQKELSDLTGRSIPIVTCSSVTEERWGQSNLILVGRYQHHARVRAILAERHPPNPLESESEFARSQGYLIAVEPHEKNSPRTILAVGWDTPGAVYAISHLRTHFRAKDSRLTLDVEKSPDSSAPFQKIYRPSFEERGVYYNLAWEDLGRLTPLHWNDDDWEYWIDKLVCAQLTHLYFFLWADDLYFPKSPETAGEEARVRHERLQRMIRHAHRRGLKVGYLFTPTQIPSGIFRANERLLKASVVYAEHGFPVVCSEVPDTLSLDGNHWDGAWDLMLDIYRRQIEWFHEVDGYQIWFYDPGGCFCGPDKYDCRGHQALRMMEQVDRFYTIARKANPRARFTVSMWPVWALEPIYQVRYRDAFLDLLSRYAAAYGKPDRIFAVTDTLTNADTTLGEARKRGFRTDGFIFPTNVETGCHLMVPMLEFLERSVQRGREYGVQAIHHMRIEEPTKFANTYFASRFYWNADQTSTEVLRQYAGWVANSNPESAERLHEALSLLDHFMCDGPALRDHAACGARIRELVESALRPLGPGKAREYEWLLTTGRAAAMIGRAIDFPEQREELAERFAALVRDSPTFSPSKTPLEKYVKWIAKGWKKENF